MIECIKYKEVNKGSLKGFADVFSDKWGAEIYGLALHEKNGAKWVNLPSKEYVDQGEKKYAPFLRFRERAHFYDFTKAVYAAVEKKIKEGKI